MNLVQEMGTTFFKEKFSKGIINIAGIVGVVVDIQAISSVKKQYGVKILDLATAKIVTVPADELTSAEPFWTFPEKSVLPIDAKASSLGLKIYMAQNHNGNRCIRLDSRQAVDQRTRIAYAEMGGWQETYSFYMENNRYKYLKTPYYATKEEAHDLLKRDTSNFRGYSMLLSPNVSMEVAGSGNLVVLYKDIGVLSFSGESKKLTHTRPETLKIATQEDESVTWLL